MATTTARSSRPPVSFTKSRSRLRGLRVAVVAVAPVRERVGHQARSVDGQGIEHDEVRVVREDGDENVREEVVDVGEQALDAALLGRDFGEALDAPEGERHAAVRAAALDDGQVVEAVGVERLRVGRADVVALEEALQVDLPAHGDLDLVGREQALLGAEQLGQARERGLRAGRAVFLGDEHQTMSLLAAHLAQTGLPEIEPGKAVGVRHVVQAAVEAIGPAVVRAHEAGLAALAVGEASAAMPAGVAEGARHAVATAHDEERRAGGFARDVAAFFGKRRRGTEGHRPAAQRALLLFAEALGRVVARDRLAPDAVAEVGGPVSDVAEHAGGDGLVGEEAICRTTICRTTICRTSRGRCFLN